MNNAVRGRRVRVWQITLLRPRSWASMKETITKKLCADRRGRRANRRRERMRKDSALMRFSLMKLMSVVSKILKLIGTLCH